MIGRGQQIVSDIIKSGPSDHKLLSTLLSKKKKKKKKTCCQVSRLLLTESHDMTIF